MSVDGVAAPAPRPVPRGRDAEPDRVRRHVSAARSATRPLPRQDRRRLPERRRTRPRCCGSRTTASRPRRSTTCNAVASPTDLIEAAHARRRDDGERRRHRVRRRARAAGPASCRASRSGASPRAAVHLLAAAKAAARLAGRAFVVPDDVVAVAPAVLRHRLQLRPEAELERYTARRRGARRDRRGPDPPMSPTPRARRWWSSRSSLAALGPPRFGDAHARPARRGRDRRRRVDRPPPARSCRHRCRRSSHAASPRR